MAGNAVFGGVIGGVTGGLFAIGGAALSSGVRSLISGGGSQGARQAAGSAARTEARNIGTGLTKGLRPKGCLHSFAPTTLVLMADGSTKPIAQVAEGDMVLSTDPGSGEAGPEKVVDLHKNQDTDLTDLTVTTQDGKRSTLHTTQHHPFWSASRGGWVDAADLIPGELLKAPDGSTVVVAGVKSFSGHRTMRDLTVEQVHTYYVMAGNTPVLVHNCGGARFAVDSSGTATDFAAAAERLPAGRNIPQGWTARVADNGKGTVFQRPGAQGNADMIRVMDPTARYPDGYVRVYNSHGQPVDVSGRPGPQSATHIPLDGTDPWSWWPN